MAISVVVLLAACAPADRNGFETGLTASSSESGSGSPGDSAGSGDDDGASGGGGTDNSGGGTDATAGDGDSDGIRLDVGDESASGGGAEGGQCDVADDDCGCTAVDIVFVIDNSTSMGSYQSALAAAAPTFGAAIFDSLPPDTDIHVGVTTTDFLGDISGGTSPGEQNCAPYYEGAGMMGRDDLYDFYLTPDTMATAKNGAQGRLYQHEGRTYFEANSSDDPTAMTNWLTGAITSPGESGSVWEMPTAGAAYPFHPANAAANAGFLRDEGAVLVIFTLTDEVGNSPEPLDAYHDMVVDAKQACGGDRCVVTGGIMKPCLMTATDTRLYPFLASFGKDPVVGDIDGDPSAFGDILSNTLAQVIAQTCDEIPPPVG